MVNKIINNNNGSTGVMLVLIPFIITILLFMVSLPIDTATDDKMITIGGMWLDIPEDYENMTWSERAEYTNISHGGNWTEDIEWRAPYWWEWATLPLAGIGGIHYLADTWGNSLITWPDGTQVRQDDLEKYIEGRAFDTDWKGIVESIVTINPPILSYLGIYGAVFRIILVIAVAIGLVEILWIG